MASNDSLSEAGRVISDDSLILADDHADPSSEAPAAGPGGQGRLVVLGGGHNGTDGNTTCWAMDLDGSKSDVIAKLPSAQRKFPYYMGACAVGDTIFITGGTKDHYVTSECTNAAWQLSMTTKTWKSVPPMRQARAGHSMAAMGNHLYVCGGCCGEDDAKIMISADRYDMDTQQWMQIADMKDKIMHCPALCIDGELFVVDGNDKNLHLYSPTSDSWQVKIMPEWSWWSTAVQHHGDLYVVGGGYGERCMKYTPSTDQWLILSDTCVARNYTAAVVYKDKIILAGGEDDDDYWSSIEEYDPNTDTWTELTLTLPKPLAYHNMLLV